MDDSYEETEPMCYFCGGDCDGNETVIVEIDGVGSGEFPVCQDPSCPGNN